MPLHPDRSFLGWLVLLALLPGAWGCQTLGAGLGGDARELSGSYRGYLWVDGEPAVSGLELRTGAGRLGATLDSEAGVRGSGEGRLSGDVLVLNIPYDTGCAGRLRLEGRLSPDGARYEGEFRAEDCTGTASGRFEFRRP